MYAPSIKAQVQELNEHVRRMQAELESLIKQTKGMLKEGHVTPRKPRKPYRPSSLGIMNECFIPSKSPLYQFMFRQKLNGNCKVPQIIDDSHLFSQTECMRAITGYINLAGLNDPTDLYVHTDLTLEKVFPEMKGPVGQHSFKYIDLLYHVRLQFKGVRLTAANTIHRTYRHYLNKKKMTELKVVLLGDPMAKQIVHSSRLLFQKVYTYL